MKKQKNSLMFVGIFFLLTSCSSDQKWDVKKCKTIIAHVNEYGSLNNGYHSLATPNGYVFISKLSNAIGIRTDESTFVFLVDAPCDSIVQINHKDSGIYSTTQKKEAIKKVKVFIDWFIENKEDLIPLEYAKDDLSKDLRDFIKKLATSTCLHCGNKKVCVLTRISLDHSGMVIYTSNDAVRDSTLYIEYCPKKSLSSIVVSHEGEVPIPMGKKRLREIIDTPWEE